MNIGDEVTVNAKVIGLSESGNPIIQFSSGVRVLVKKEDINTVIMDEKSKSCSNCKYSKRATSQEPCCRCDIHDNPFFERKE